MLDAVSGWALDAERDDIVRYGLAPACLQAVASGAVSLVEGARGSGKTALARLLAETPGSGRAGVRVALSEDLLTAMSAVDRSPSLSGREPRAPDPFGLGAYLARLGVFVALFNSGALDGASIRTLSHAFAAPMPPRLSDAFARTAPRALLSDTVAATDPSASGDVRPYLDRIDAALSAVSGAGRAPILVVFDEATTRRSALGALDALLADAMGDLLTATGLGAPRPLPLGARACVLARPELLGAVASEARGQHVRADLVWSAEALGEMAAFRLARAASPDFTPAEVRASSVWRRFFAGSARSRIRKLAGGDGLDALLERRARARPRDLVHWLSVCAARAGAHGKDTVTAVAFAEAEVLHARYIRATLADELRDDVPEIEQILERLAGLRAREGGVAALHQALEAALVQADAAEPVAGSRAVMRRLFEASAIGTVRADAQRRTRAVYRCHDRSAEFSLTDPVAVHPAVADALGIAKADRRAA